MIWFEVFNIFIYIYFLKMVFILQNNCLCDMFYNLKFRGYNKDKQCVIVNCKNYLVGMKFRLLFSFIYRCFDIYYQGSFVFDLDEEMF